MAAERTPLTWLMRQRIPGDPVWSEWLICRKVDFDTIKAKPLNWGIEYEAVAVVALPDGVSASDQRDRFEVWADDQGFPLKRLDTSDGYLDLRTHGMWESWQAAVAGMSAPDGEQL